MWLAGIDQGIKRDNVAPLSVEGTIMARTISASMAIAAAAH
jgi:hypothetical protein